MYSQTTQFFFHYQNNWSEFVEKNINLKLIWKYFSELCTLVQGNATDTFNLIAFEDVVKVWTDGLSTKALD